MVPRLRSLISKSVQFEKDTTPLDIVLKAIDEKEVTSDDAILNISKFSKESRYYFEQNYKEVIAPSKNQTKKFQKKVLKNFKISKISKN